MPGLYIMGLTLHLLRSGLVLLLQYLCTFAEKTLVWVLFLLVYLNAGRGWEWIITVSFFPQLSFVLTSFKYTVAWSQPLPYKYIPYYLLICQHLRVHMVLDDTSFFGESCPPQDHCHLMMEMPGQHAQFRMQGRKGLDLIEILILKKVLILGVDLEAPNSLELSACTVVRHSRRSHQGTGCFHWLSQPCTWLGAGSQPSPHAYLALTGSAQLCYWVLLPQLMQLFSSLHLALSPRAC